jgi:hypothetical protein
VLFGKYRVECVLGEIWPCTGVIVYGIIVYSIHSFMTYVSVYVWIFSSYIVSSASRTDTYSDIMLLYTCLTNFHTKELGICRLLSINMICVLLCIVY